MSVRTPVPTLSGEGMGANRTTNEKEVIFKDDLETIVGKRPFKTNSEKIEEAKLLKNK